MLGEGDHWTVRIAVLAGRLIAAGRGQGGSEYPVAFGQEYRRGVKGRKRPDRAFWSCRTSCSPVLAALPSGQRGRIARVRRLSRCARLSSRVGS